MQQLKESNGEILEPDNVWLPSSGTAAKRLFLVRDAAVRFFRPGYRYSPETCIHQKKLFFRGQWSCQDCGDDL